MPRSCICISQQAKHNVCGESERKLSGINICSTSGGISSEEGRVAPLYFVRCTIDVQEYMFLADQLGREMHRENAQSWYLFSC